MKAIVCILVGMVWWEVGAKTNNIERLYLTHQKWQNNINFEVRLTAPRRFVVLFENPDGNPIYVRVYDMVGNQVIQDISNQKGRYVKEFDMSNNRSEVFLVEVGNARNSSTKRIFLQR